MNDGKLTEQTEALPLAETTSGPTANPSGAEDMDRRRRRLIRGAVGIAPVVLTLRSGGLAAAVSGCAAVVYTPTGALDGTTGKLPGTPTDISEGYVCVKNAATCGSSPSGPPAIRAGTGTATGPLTKVGSDYFCVDFPGQNVVIISSAASLM